MKEKKQREAIRLPLSFFFAYPKTAHRNWQDCHRKLRDHRRAKQETDTIADQRRGDSDDCHFNPTAPDVADRRMGMAEFNTAASAYLNRNRDEPATVTRQDVWQEGKSWLKSLRAKGAGGTEQNDVVNSAEDEASQPGEFGVEVPILMYIGS